MTAVMMSMVVVMMVVVFVQYHLCPHPAHALFHHFVDNNFERIDVERLEFLIQLVDRYAQPYERTENHIPARPANAFKMQCLFFHDAGKNDRF